MHIEYNVSRGLLTLSNGNSKEYIHCFSNVRNEINKRRLLHNPKEVVRSIPSGYPYMPRPFPIGEWKITGVKRRKETDKEYGYLGPAFISTNAFQRVEIWDLDKGNGYDKPSGIFVLDSGYGFHYARDSITTLGCGRLDSAKDALYLASLCEGKQIDLIVISSLS